jgi:hypothetical protein
VIRSMNQRGLASRPTNGGVITNIFCCHHVSREGRQAIAPEKSQLRVIRGVDGFQIYVVL